MSTTDSVENFAGPFTNRMVCFPAGRLKRRTGVSDAIIFPSTKTWTHGFALTVSIPGSATVLFVGTGPYTWQFERLFRRSREQYTSIDPESATAVWGARNHFVAPVQDIGLYRPKGHFDCIVFNGVFGFGINDLDGQRAAIEVLHDALAPGGLLLVGWNTNLLPDLEALGLFSTHFTAAEGLPWPHRTLFALPETHVYDFYTRRPD